MHPSVDCDEECQRLSSCKFHSAHFYYLCSPLFSFPHLVKCLQFQIILLALIASSQIFFIWRFLFPPAIPIFLRKDAIDAAGNPLHPTSTAHIFTFQPFTFPCSCRGAYLDFFSSPDTSILSSTRPDLFSLYFLTPIAYLVLDL